MFFIYAAVVEVTYVQSKGGTNTEKYTDGDKSNSVQSGDFVTDKVIKQIISLHFFSAEY